MAAVPKFLESKIWGGKRESNPQPPEPQSGALPVELFPPQDINYSKGCRWPGQALRSVGGVWFWLRAAAAVV